MKSSSGRHRQVPVPAVCAHDDIWAWSLVARPNILFCSTDKSGMHWSKLQDAASDNTSL